MARKFPAMKPSSRSFQMGELPVKTYRALSGVTVRRVFGNKQLGYTLTLEYKNIADSGGELLRGTGRAVDIIDHYNDVSTTLGTFELPDKVFAGMTDRLESKIQQPYSNLRWRYAEPPTIKSVIEGVSTVSVKLVGEIKV